MLPNFFFLFFFSPDSKGAPTAGVAIIWALRKGQPRGFLVARKKGVLLESEKILGKERIRR